jgi:hypothetical protein
VPWGPSALACATIACRSGLTPHPFDRCLEQTAALDREAMAQDATAVASLITAELEPAIAMAKEIEEAGLRVLELNIGTPYPCARTPRLSDNGPDRPRRTGRWRPRPALNTSNAAAKHGSSTSKYLPRPEAQ